MSAQHLSILVVSKPQVCEKTAHVLASLDVSCTLIKTQSLGQAMDVLYDTPFSCALVQSKLRDGTASSWLHTLKAQGLWIPTIVLTHEHHVLETQEALTQGAHDCLNVQELHPDTMLRSIYYAIQRHHSQRLNERIIQTGHLNTVGRLAVGAMREAKDPASWISSNLELMRVRVQEISRNLTAGRPPSIEQLSELLDWVNECSNGMERISSTMRKVHDYATMSGDRDGAIDVNAMVHQLAVVSCVEQVHKVRLIEEYDPHVPKLVGDLSLFLQAIHHVLNNAAEAIDSYVWGDRAHEICVRTLCDGSELVISIEDNGVGMVDEIRERVFEPFFSIHTQGKVRGMGLSITRDIMARYQGHVEVVDDPHVLGTLVKLRVPMRSSMLRPETISQEVDVGPHDEIEYMESPHQMQDDWLRLLVTVPLHLSKQVQDVLAGHELIMTATAEDALFVISSDTHFDGILYALDMEGMNGYDFYNVLQWNASSLRRRLVFLAEGEVSPALDAFVAQIPNSVIVSPLSEETMRPVLEHWASVEL